MGTGHARTALRRAAAKVGWVPNRLCLLSVHAHPDDEASKGAPTVAKYHAEGVRAVLVCCTGGEEGDILNPAMDTPEVRADIGRIRMAELKASTDIIGYDETVLLGYRDSGMPDTEANENPASFAQAPIDEAVERLVAVIRRERPQVLITYGEDHAAYPHPDHIKVHDISVLAFDSASDPDKYPEAGPPFAPAKLYYSVWAASRFREIHAKFDRARARSRRSTRSGSSESRTTRSTRRRSTSHGFTKVRAEALKAHATQVDPNSPFWFGLPPEVMAGSTRPRSSTSPTAASGRDRRDRGRPLRRACAERWPRRPGRGSPS